MCQLNGVLGPHLSPSVTEVPFVVLLQIGQHIRMYCFGIGVCSLSLGGSSVDSAEEVETPGE